MKKKVIAYLHTHWDREWYREFEVFRLRLLRVFDNILNLLESNKIPSFYFDGQVVALLDYLELRPEKEQLIRNLIKEKKLFIGPFYCLIDEFLTDRTTFEKNIEIGLKIAKDFGCEDFIGYFADTFGHSKNIPPILKSYGIDKAIVWRGVPDLPAEFIFNGVNTVNLIRGYFMDIFSAKISLEEKANWLKDNLDKIAEKSGDYLLLPIGADHLGVEKDISEQIESINKLLEDYEIELSSPFEYFEKVKDNFKTEWNDELRDNSKTFILPGSYSARTRLKQYRTEASYRLQEADKLQQKYGSNYANVIEYAYKLLLQNQAHDSICGCSTDLVHLENFSRYEKVLQISRTIIEELKLEHPEIIDSIKNSGFEFNSSAQLNGFETLKISKSVEDNLLYDTQRIPITEDFKEIYTLKKSCQDPLEVAIEISNKKIKVNDLEIEFTRCTDNGDTYNFGPIEDEMEEIAQIQEIYRVESNDSFIIKTSFFNVELSRNDKLVNFKINWNNEFENKLWQAKIKLPNPVTKTFSEDLNSIIERSFDPYYKLREHLPKEKGIEARTNFAPMQRYVGAQGYGIITKGLNEYEVEEEKIAITLLRSVGVISNPKNSSRSTPAGPPIEVPNAQQLGYNIAEFSIGKFEPEEAEDIIKTIYPEIV